jgi:hypothetical protein
MTLTRRKTLEMVGISVASLVLGTVSGGCSQEDAKQSTMASGLEQSPPPPIARVAPFVYPEKQWYETELNNFVENLPNEQMVAMQIAAKNLPEDATVANLFPTRSEDAYKFLYKLLYVSSAAAGAWNYDDMWTIDYHNRVDWLRQKLDIPCDDPQNATTFQLERAIYARVHAQMWDTTPGDQRLLLLNKIEKRLESGTIDGKVEISLMTGSNAQNSLSRLGFLEDYRFYEVMLITLRFMAELCVIGLPKASMDLLESAEDDYAVLAKPIAACIADVLACLKILEWAGSLIRASVGQTLPIVCQIHAIKVAAIRAAGRDLPRLST